MVTRSIEMIEQIYRPLAELKELHIEEQRERKKSEYDRMKAAKRLAKQKRGAKS
jgi:pantothenate kinase